MPVICPTCQNVFSRGTGQDVPVGDEILTLHGVVFDILVERPIHGSETLLGRSDSGQAVRSAQQRSALRRRAKMGWMTLRIFTPINRHKAAVPGFRWPCALAKAAGLS
jgi:hypothetical protein